MKKFKRFPLRLLEILLLLAVSVPGIFLFFDDVTFRFLLPLPFGAAALFSLLEILRAYILLRSDPAKGRKRFTFFLFSFVLFLILCALSVLYLFSRGVYS